MNDRLRTLTNPRPSRVTVVAVYFSFSSGRATGNFQPSALMTVRLCDTSARVAASLDTGPLCSTCRHPAQKEPDNATSKIKTRLQYPDCRCSSLIIASIIRQQAEQAPTQNYRVTVSQVSQTKWDRLTY